MERILASSQFRTTQRLREFLLYISECALNKTPEAATEQQIGVHVFHRPAGYNSSEDSIVRTHARLLRQKLAEYFATEGAEEPVIIEVPKGHYLPIFRARQSAPPPAPFAVPVEPAAPVAAPAGSRSWRSPLGIAVGVVALAAVVVAWLAHAARVAEDHGGKNGGRHLLGAVFNG